jgi:hypothetical protein
VRLVLFDVATMLRSAKEAGVGSFAEAIQNAERDAEWLLLPADPFSGQAGAELTSLLDDSCISRREKFALR